MKKKLLIAIFSFAAILFAGLSQMYLVVDSSGGTVYAKGNEAYLFTGNSHQGYHFSYLAYPFVLAKEKLNIPTEWNDSVASSLVIHVTPVGIERQEVDFPPNGVGSPMFLTPFDDGFYGMCSGGILCKWEGRSFRPATEEEQIRHGVNLLARDTQEDSYINGWHFRRTSQLQGETFSIRLDNGTVISAENHAKDSRRRPSFSIDILRPSLPAERLYNVNGDPHRVSRAEYQRIFHNSEAAQP